MALRDKRHEDYIKLIYLKTGMPFRDELKAAAEARFCHVGVSDLNCFLNSESANAASSDLLRQYRARISQLAKDQERAEREWNMDWGPIQHEFAERLKEKTEPANGSWATHDGEPDCIWKHRNRGGGYWTQYRFFGWHLFWRMDTGSDLRMMVDVRQGRSSGDVRQYQEAFGRACEGVVNPAKFNFRRGNEMTIGAIPYSNGREIGEDVDAFLASIAQVHERFLRELSDNPAA